MLEVLGEIPPKDMTDRALGPLYLLGYASQYNELRPTKNAEDKTAEEGEASTDDA